MIQYLLNPAASSESAPHLLFLDGCGQVASFAAHQPFYDRSLWARPKAVVKAWTSVFPGFFPFLSVLHEASVCLLTMVRDAFNATGFAPPGLKREASAATVEARVSTADRGTNHLR